MEPLEIPLKLDTDQLRRDLGKLAEAGRQAGKEMGEGIDRADDSVKGMSLGVEDLGKQFVSMLTISAGVDLLKGGLDTVLSGLKASADEAARMAKEFGDFRRMTLELAGVQGKSASNEFAKEQIDLATSAGVAPDRLVQYQNAIQQEIGGNVGEGRTLDQGQFNELVKTTTAFGVSRGISPEGISRLLGGLTRSTKGGPDADKQIIERFGKLVNLMDSAPGKIETLLPELNEVMATGVAPEQAGSLVAVMAGRGSPGQAGTYARALGRSFVGISQRAAEGKGSDFGITDSDSSAVASKKLLDAARAQGIDTGNEKVSRRWLFSQGIHAQEEQDAILAAWNIGIGGSGFANADATIAAGGAGVVTDQIGRFRDSSEGKQQAAEAATAAKRLEIGERFSPFELAKEQARKDIQEQLVHPGLSGLAMDWLPDSIFGSYQDTLTNTRAVGILTEQARARGVPESEIPLHGNPAGIPLGVSESSRYAEQLISAMDKLVANTAPITPALSAPPPNPETRP